MPNDTQNNGGKQNYYKKKKYYNKQKSNQNVIETNNIKQNTINEFASYSSRQAYSNYYFGLNIFDLYSSEQLAELVKDPMTNNKLLREISRILYGTSGTYTNTVDYMVAMPTLDKVIVPHGTDKNKRRQNKEMMESTLRTIKDKEIIRDALWRGIIEGSAFYYFETTGRPASMEKTLTDFDVNNIVEINELGINASIISLSAEYTEIVGRKNNSYVIAFNLDYFDTAQGEITERKLKKFPREIRDAYHERKTKDGYKGGNWVILDNRRTVVHKIRSELKEKYGRPLVLAAIKDILYDDYFTSTKRNVLNEINNKVIYQTLPEGQNKGTCALTKAQQENQHNTVKNAITHKNNRGGTSFITVAAGTKLDTLNVGNTDIFDSKNEEKLGDKIALSLGFASSALNGVGAGSYSSQQTNLELVTAQIFQWVEQIESELNKCISENIINDRKNWAECRYLPMTFVNKGTMVGYMKDLYLQGKGSLSLWASACGISPDVFFALLEQELDENIEDRFPVHKTSYTMSSKESQGGRPKTDNPTDKTILSRANNGNDLPSPSDNK